MHNESRYSNRALEKMSKYVNAFWRQLRDKTSWNLDIIYVYTNSMNNILEISLYMYINIHTCTYIYSKVYNIFMQALWTDNIWKHFIFEFGFSSRSKNFQRNICVRYILCNSKKWTLWSPNSTWAPDVDLIIEIVACPNTPECQIRIKFVFLFTFVWVCMRMCVCTQMV